MENFLLNSVRTQNRKPKGKYFFKTIFVYVKVTSCPSSKEKRARQKNLCPI
jgi:hypothetical protein